MTVTHRMLRREESAVVYIGTIFFFSVSHASPFRVTLRCPPTIQSFAGQASISLNPTAPEKRISSYLDRKPGKPKTVFLTQRLVYIYHFQLKGNRGPGRNS